MTYLKIENLSIKDNKTKEILLDDISIDIEKNTILGVVGESGSGKSLLCKTILGLTSSNLNIEGKITLNNKDILNNSKIIKDNFCVILQEAINAFNPLYTIKYQMLESIKTKQSKKEKLKTCIKYLRKVGLKRCSKILKSYPHELSGGQLQRVMIAIALTQNRKIIIADELTSSLDSINQKEIINILKNLKDKTIIIVSHDLALISHIAKDIIVLKDSKVVEKADAKTIFTNTENKYTKFLVSTQENLSKEFMSCLK